MNFHKRIHKKSKNLQSSLPPPLAVLQPSRTLEQWAVNSGMEGWLSGHKVNHDDDINDGDDSDDDIHDSDHINDGDDINAGDDINDGDDSDDDNRIYQRTTNLQFYLFTQSCPAFKRGRRVEGSKISGETTFVSEL